MKSCSHRSGTFAFLESNWICRVNVQRLHPCWLKCFAKQLVDGGVSCQAIEHKNICALGDCSYSALYFALQITFQLVISRSLCRLQLMGPCHSRRRTSEVATQTSRLLPLRKAVKEICRLLRKRQWWAAAGRDPRIPKSLWSLIGLQLKRRAILFQHLERVKGVLRYKA